MQDSLLVDESLIAYADIEDHRVFMIQSVLVKDSSQELEPVWSVVGSLEPATDYVEDNPMYLYGKARVRTWKLPS